jgi:hypothetical protein
MAHGRRFGGLANVARPPIGCRKQAVDTSHGSGRERYAA